MSKQLQVCVQLRPPQQCSTPLCQNKRARNGLQLQHQYEINAKPTTVINSFRKGGGSTKNFHQPPPTTKTQQQHPCTTEAGCSPVHRAPPTRPPRAPHPGLSPGSSELRYHVKQRTLLNHTRYDDPSIRTDTTQVNSVTTVPIT